MFNQLLKVDFSYSVSFTSDLFSLKNKTLENLELKSSFVFLDSGVASSQKTMSEKVEKYFLHSSNAFLLGPVQVLEGGEKCKNNIKYLLKIYELIIQYKVDRHSHILAIGGGAFLDLVGLACSTAHRGIKLIRVPTTLLAQADAGVGVKNGINLFGQKNFMGSFSTPAAVFNDFDFLSTLTPRDKRSGMSESVKVALIKDHHFFSWLENSAQKLRNFDKKSVKYLIQKTAKLHLDHISKGKDPFEKGNSRPLDFGHWLAHKIELISLHEIKHGEAVAIGIAVDSFYSYKKNWLTQKEFLRIVNLLQELGFKIFSKYLLVKSSGQFEILKGLNEFKEHLGGELSIAMLNCIGESHNISTIDSETIIQSFSWLEEYEKMEKKEDAYVNKNQESRICP